MLKSIVMAAAMAASLVGTPASAANEPTIVLVHGAFADASGWNGVIERLQKKGYPVVAVANPLRSVSGDAAYLRHIVENLQTSVVLVGHSYGGAVITEAAGSLPNVRSLVYVGAFAPDVGETVLGLSGKNPGSTLGEALDKPVELGAQGRDFYIRQDLFHAQFAADIPLASAQLMAAEQRPIAEAALNEAVTSAAWKSLPSWFIYGDADRNIPPVTMGWMADRAHSKRTVVIEGASHVPMISNPEAVSDLIEQAAGNH